MDVELYVKNSLSISMMHVPVGYIYTLLHCGGVQYKTMYALNKLECASGGMS